MLDSQRPVDFTSQEPSPRSRVRRLTGRLLWRQWLTLLIGLGVIAATLVVGQLARHDAERSQRVEVLSERVSAASQQLNAVTWQALAEPWVGGPQRLNDLPAIVHQGFVAWASVSNALRELRALSSPAHVAQLDRDAATLYGAGTHALQVFLHGGAKTPLQLERDTLRPALDALTADSEHAAAVQQKVADQASNRATIADVGSVVLGFVLVLLLSWWLHLMHRRSLIANERRRGERRTDQRIHALVENASDLICVVAEDLTVRWQSSSIQRMLGHDPGRRLGERLTGLVHPEDADLMERQVATVVARPGGLTFSVRFRHADGGWRNLEVIAENRLADPAVHGIVMSMRDITERKALEEELRHQAFHDSLTGLANRALFEDRLAHALAGARRHGWGIAVLFLDLDDFKTINDSLGHACGDELLRTVAHRIRGVARATDTAARLGGDEFAVLLDTIDDASDAGDLALRILDALVAPVRIGDHELRVTASIGLARGEGSIGVDELLRNADTAMYAAKESGKSTVQAFEEGMHRRVLDRLELTAQLRRALELEQFELDYQPIVALQTGRIAGVEALVRWAHPERGRLAPDRFIGLAEETGLIIPLGAWILTSACALANRWRGGCGNDAPPYICVNASARQLHDDRFPETVTDALRSTGLDPGALVIEMTESLLADDSEAMIGRLEALRALGVRIAVDDFGTGYSALSRLQRFPIDILKIDRSFSCGIESDTKKAQLVRGIVNLAQSLDLLVIAEGIEEVEQAERLLEMHARFGQGYLFSRPVSDRQLESLLGAGKPLTGAMAPGNV